MYALPENNVQHFLFLMAYPSHPKAGEVRAALNKRFDISIVFLNFLNQLNSAEAITYFLDPKQGFLGLIANGDYLAAMLESPHLTAEQVANLLEANGDFIFAGYQLARVLNSPHLTAAQVAGLLASKVNLITHCGDLTDVLNTPHLTAEQVENLLREKGGLIKYGRELAGVLQSPHLTAAQVDRLLDAKGGLIDRDRDLAPVFECPHLTPVHVANSLETYGRLIDRGYQLRVVLNNPHLTPEQVESLLRDKGDLITHWEDLAGVLQSPHLTASQVGSLLRDKGDLISSARDLARAINIPHLTPRWVAELLVVNDHYIVYGEDLVGVLKSPHLTPVQVANLLETKGDLIGFGGDLVGVLKSPHLTPAQVASLLETKGHLIVSGDSLAAVLQSPHLTAKQAANLLSHAKAAGFMSPAAMRIALKKFPAAVKAHYFTVACSAADADADGDTESKGVEDGVAPTPDSVALSDMAFIESESDYCLLMDAFNENDAPRVAALLQYNYMICSDEGCLSVLKWHVRHHQGWIGEALLLQLPYFNREGITLAKRIERMLGIVDASVNAKDDVCAAFVGLGCLLDQRVEAPVSSEPAGGAGAGERMLIMPLLTMIEGQDAELVTGVDEMLTTLLQRLSNVPPEDVDNFRQAQERVYCCATFLLEQTETPFKESLSTVTVLLLSDKVQGRHIGQTTGLFSADKDPLKEKALKRATLEEKVEAAMGSDMREVGMLHLHSVVRGPKGASGS